MTTTQIFIQEDNKVLIYDNDQLDEFKSLVNELGLRCNNVKDADKSPIPYMWLDEATIRAFKLICPRVDLIEKYQLEIPLEILRNVKLSKTENYFDSIEIWSNQKDPDPFAIGVVFKDQESREKGYTWNSQKYLIGRWSAENKTIPELFERALKIASERIENYCASEIAKLTSWKTCPEIWAGRYIQNGDSEASAAIGSGNNDLTLPF
jgi:hypothetical protein